MESLSKRQLAAQKLRELSERIAGNEDIDSIRYIYALFENDSAVYVGQTKTPMKRYLEHCHSRGYRLKKPQRPLTFGVKRTVIDGQMTYHFPLHSEWIKMVVLEKTNVTLATERERFFINEMINLGHGLYNTLLIESNEGL